MKKNCCFIMLLLLVLITACSNSIEKTQESTGEVASAENSVLPVESGSEEEGATQEDKGDRLFQSFLNNEAKVTIGDSNIGCNFTEYKDKQYTLEELVNIIIAGYVGEPDSGVRIRIESIEYAYIDCGDDGKKELALKIYTPIFGTEYIIVRENDGNLEMIYSDTSTDRSHIHLNEYGYFYNDNSGGAANQGLYKSFLDADGKNHYLYYVESNGLSCKDKEYGTELWIGSSFQLISTDIELDGSYALFRFDFNNTLEDDSDDIYSYAEYDGDDVETEPDNGYRGYFYAKLSYDETIYSDNHPLKQIFNKAYTLKEIDQMIAEKETSEGLSEKVKNGKAVEWIPLEISFKPFIASYNNNNILETDEFFPLRFECILDSQVEEPYTYMTLNANGEFNVIYRLNSSTEQEDTFYQNEGNGTFEVKEKINDHTYKLNRTYYTSVNTPGTYGVDHGWRNKIIKIKYVEIPGIDDGCTEFTLLTPGTPIEEIDPKIVDSWSEYYKEDNIVDGSFTNYLLIEDGGDGYAWIGTR